MLVGIVIYYKERYRVIILRLEVFSRKFKSLKLIWCIRYYEFVLKDFIF